MKYIYHFTSLKSLHLILKENNIFFSNSENTNDPREWQYQDKIAKEVIDKYANENKCGVLALINTNTPSNDMLKIFTLSFSRDLENIHNWMEYGDYGYGVAIKFNYNELCNFIDGYLEGYLKLKKVNYSKSKFKSKIKEILKRNDINNLEKVNCILCEYPFFKHFSYSIEKEYRLCFIDGLERSVKNVLKDIFYFDNINNKYKLNVHELINKNIIDGFIFGSNVSKNDINIIKGLLLKYNDVELIKNIRISNTAVRR